jgi:lipid II:glycine glycyltransferase (peptidoglycan interpeptide bridge formation enzyme)
LQTFIPQAVINQQLKYFAKSYTYFRTIHEKDETVKKNKEEIEQLTKDLESR